MKSVFREYDIRGMVDIDFTVDKVELLGKAIGTYFIDHGIDDVVIGHDCRHSSPVYHEALTGGLLSTGVCVVSIGMSPTPALYYSVLRLVRRGGVMITASHNPPQYNGFKIWSGETTIHGAEIQKIREIFYKQRFAVGTGVASRYDIAPEYTVDILSRVRLGRPMKVVVDGGNGVGGTLCVDILRRMGADVLPLYCDPDPNFPHHHPDPVVEDNMRELMAVVQEQGADVGIGLDGDADRLGVVDDAGRLLYGDEVLALFARDLLARCPGALVIGDVKCSDRLFADIRAHGGEPLMWRTGHSVMKAKMKAEKAPLGGEMSGHLFFAEGWHGFDDAIYGAARLLSILSSQSRPLRELPGWPAAFATREILIHCPDAHKRAVMEMARAHFASRYETVNLDGVRVAFAHGWGLVRASNTQPALTARFEADTPAHLAAIRAQMEAPLHEWIARVACGPEQC